ncbi:MAG: glycogen debranching enzyme family protein, partial [Acidobacteria bacterium]|nr:glycogen debranching enzyme family protein [Acidobacteriota bacterium]
REWLVTNGLGGYASGTLGGVATRRFHGLLIAALPAPFGRTMMLNRLSETLHLPEGTAISLCGEESQPDAPEIIVAQYLAEFRLERGLPVWRFEIGQTVLEKYLLLPHRQNTVQISYKLLAGPGPVQLELRPALYFRPHEGRVDEPLLEPYTLLAKGDRYEISGRQGHPPLRLRLLGEEAALTLKRDLIRDLHYRVEARRGYDAQGVLWSPGSFTTELSVNRTATLIASSEAWETVDALAPEEALSAERERRERLLLAAPPQAQEGLGAELVLAADQFIIVPAGRIEEAARARAAGDEVRTVIAGYHWFTDWGRDTMISLEGLTLATGRLAEAGWILRTFAHYVRDGLIPNVFPEGEREGLYHTADASLWFFHALDRYLQATGDRETLRVILPALREIVQQHLNGTHFGIGMDERDGLLRQGAAGYQLTWMDAKVGDWVVTPRRGKAVEINALWYNALRLLAQWVSQEENAAEAESFKRYAEQAKASFNARFWYGAGGYLYDVIDGEHGDDAACRPNQVLAFSLTHPVLARERWQPVLEVVKARLLTPVGLRSLAPGHPDYQVKYDGDLRTRDAAYHQGTVWTWLLGPFLDAWLRVFPADAPRARRLLSEFDLHLNEACVGSISEIFDAEPPYQPRGCMAQAWSVAEVLRTWVKTAS